MCRGSVLQSGKLKGRDGGLETRRCEMPSFPCAGELNPAGQLRAATANLTASEREFWILAYPPLRFLDNYYAG